MTKTSVNYIQIARFQDFITRVGFAVSFSNELFFSFGIVHLLNWQNFLTACLNMQFKFTDRLYSSLYASPPSSFYSQILPHIPSSFQ